MAEIKVSWDFDSAVFKPWLGLNRHFHILGTSSKLGKEEKKKQKQQQKLQSSEKGITRVWEELGERNKCDQNNYIKIVFLIKSQYVFLDKEPTCLKEKRLVFPTKCINY